ncbi:hypothetical protein DH2020_001722 [Rehmannia glutinosa]|uniref:GATA transcription factor n=1 Tax=Rehmannia glutinosa TaxID=99300 RepID=A0ABR0XS76_REHGL
MANPEFFDESLYNAEFPTEMRLSDAKNSDHFIIEDLLDFPNDDGMVAADGGVEAAWTGGTSTDSSAATAVDNSCNSSFSTAEPHFPAADIGGPGGGQFASELCVPYDDMAELEWLSNFVDESFSSDDLQKLQLIQGMKARTNEVSETHQYQFQPETTRPGSMLIPSEMSVPAKARSKRSRAAPGTGHHAFSWCRPHQPPYHPRRTPPARSRRRRRRKRNRRRRAPPETAAARGGSASIALPTRPPSGGPGPWARRRCATRVG